MKASVWRKAKKRLITEYQEAGITRCEVCGSTWAMSFHHLARRSSLKAENTFEGTRLLCAKCHFKADQAPGWKAFNEELKKIR